MQARLHGGHGVLENARHASNQVQHQALSLIVRVCAAALTLFPAAPAIGSGNSVRQLLDRMLLQAGRGSGSAPRSSQRASRKARRGVKKLLKQVGRGKHRWPAPGSFGTNRRTTDSGALPLSESSAFAVVSTLLSENRRPAFRQVRCRTSQPQLGREDQSVPQISLLRCDR